MLSPKCHLKSHIDLKGVPSQYSAWTPIFFLLVMIGVWIATWNNVCHGFLSAARFEQPFMVNQAILEQGTPGESRASQCTSQSAWQTGSR